MNAFVAGLQNPCSLHKSSRMNSSWFWRNWTADYRWLWFGLAIVAIFSIGYLGYGYVNGTSGVIHWDRFQEQKVLESTVHSFHVGPFELAVPAESYVVIEYFNGSHIAMNVASSIIFVSVLIAAVVMLLTVITTLERFWYFGGMTLFILFVVSLRLDVLNVAGQRNQIPTIAVLLLFTALSFYFKSINSSVTFVRRLLSFGALTIVVGLAINFLSEVPRPFLHLSVTGYTAGIILTVPFILMVAHEIPAAFVSVTSQGNSKSLRHFVIISTIYLLNVIIACLHELNIVRWNFIYIDPYLLLVASGILGLWGFKLRENLYQEIMPFAPFGAYFFTALAGITFITIAQLLVQANDPALRIVRYTILFSHAGYGVIFMLYVFSNFILLLAQNLPVRKILYKPNRMPYFTFRFAGLIATLGFVFYSNWHQYIYNGIAGFYNNIADLYEVIDRTGIAEQYYQQATNYGFGNAHANYELGVLKTEQLNFEKAHDYYFWANAAHPTVYSLVNEGNAYLWESRWAEASTAYKGALHRYPRSGELQNNIGFVLGKMHNLDSASYFLNEARRNSNAKKSAEANFIAFAALDFIPINVDSVIKVFDDPYTATEANALAAATAQRTVFKTNTDVLKGKKLDLYSASLLNNYLVRNAKSLDTAFLQRANRVISDSINSDFSEALKASLAFGYYHAGNVAHAMEIMGELAYITQSHKGKFNYVMGLWSLEQRNPSRAIGDFTYAVEGNYKEAKLYRAIALSEAGKTLEAMTAWDTVRRSVPDASQIAASMQQILSVGFQEAISLPDPQKYQFCRYRLNVKDTILFDKLFPTFSNDDYRAKALLDMTTRQFEWGNSRKAIIYFNEVGGLKLTSKSLYEEVRHMELLMLAERGDLQSLARQINKGITFDSGRALEKIYFTALMQEMSGDTISAAKNYNVLAVYNPYFEEGVIAAANFFRTHGTDRVKPYTILSEAIQVNNSSHKLLIAYAKEARRDGFDEYAEGALQRANELLH